jgi:hypothetical protein
VLFGDKCDYFENCFALLTMLDSDNVFANVHTFTPLICHQITWAIINDSRQYFFRTITADHFSSGRVRWPTLLLMQIIWANIQACREIAMGNFPDKWKETATVGSYLHPQGSKRDAHKAFPTFAAPAGLPPPVPPQWSTPQTGNPAMTPDSAALGQSGRPVTIRHVDIHPMFTQLMARYITHFGSVQLQSLLRVAGLSEAELPTIPKYTKDGKNMLCYAYVLGKCQDKMCGKLPHGHASALDITDTFAKELCGRLRAAVEQRLAMEPPTLQGQYGGGWPNKWFKRTA